MVGYGNKLKRILQGRWIESVGGSNGTGRDGSENKLKRVLQCEQSKRRALPLASLV
jgi:hypothetical protein